MASVLSLIIRREYAVRVRQRVFWVATLLAPLLLIGFMFIPTLAGLFLGKERLEIYVDDPSGKVLPKLTSSDRLVFKPLEQPVAEFKATLASRKEVALLTLPADLSKKSLGATYLAAKAPSLGAERELSKKLEQVLQDYRYTQFGLNPTDLDAASLDFDLDTQQVSDTGGERKTNSVLAFIFGNIMGIVVYLMVAIYGQIVLRGVAEEKTNRIVEVMVSTVKPAQLLLGKIIGIGAVGLTQILVWMVSVTLIVVAILPLLAGLTPAPPPEALETAGRSSFSIEQVQNAFGVLQWWMGVLFVLYFIGGFLMYGSLFAAVGAASDQQADSNQLSGILVIPLLIPVFVLQAIVQNPNGALSVAFSYIPFFSPITMMVRVAATPVPWWEIALSLLILAGFVVLSGWVSGRIYRVGILLYGQKATLGKMVKWAVART